jgi:hypothetical protein
VFGFAAVVVVVEGRSGGTDEGRMRGFRRVEAREMNALESSRGDGTAFEVGQSRRYPDGEWGSGRTWKLRLHIALWTFVKYSVTSFEEMAWYLSCRFVK